MSNSLFYMVLRRLGLGLITLLAISLLITLGVEALPSLAHVPSVHQGHGSRPMGL